MKKIISRILIIFIVIIMMFEFCFSSNVSYALDISEEFINGLTSLAGGLVAYGIWFQRIIGVAISSIFNEILSVYFAGSCGVNWGSEWDFATPYAIFFNKYKLFDVNLFDISGSDNIMNRIRNSAAEWFYVMRNISASVLLCILIYVGIRMAISTIAEDKAKYKKMFFDWCCSLALIFVLQYIAIFVIYANNAIVNALKELYTGSDLDTAIGKIALQALMPVGMQSIVATLVYIMIIFQTVSFMIAYMQRVLKVAFLLIISPLISITYSIDKMGDGKAQALNAWLKEFIYTILIQPFHCIIYMAFVNAAIALLTEETILETFASIFTTEYNHLANGVLVILCLKFVNDGENAIRKIFNFQDDSSLTSMAAGAMVGIAVVKNAKNIGSSAVSGVNKFKNFSANLKGNLAADAANAKALFPNLSNNKFASAISNGKSKIGEMGEAFSKTKVGQGVAWAGDKMSKAGKWVAKGPQAYKNWSNSVRDNLIKDANDPTKNRVITGAKSWLAKGLPTTHNLKNAVPGAFGMMGFAMSYATGTSGVLEAYGMQKGIEQGADQLLSSTLGTMSEDAKPRDDDRVEAQLEQEKYARNDNIRTAAKTASVDGKVPDAYSTDQKIEGVVQQYLKDEQTLDMEKRQKGAVPQAKLDEIAARREKLEQDGVLGAVKQRAELSTSEGVEKFKSEKIKKNAIYGESFSPKELEAKAQTLLAAILELKLKLKQSDSETDSDMQNNLTDSDVSSAEKILDSLRRTIDRSFVDGSGGTFDMSRMLQQEMGLDDDGSSTYQAVMRAALDYREGVANNRAESVYETWGKLNGSRQSLAEKAHNIDLSS